MSVAKDRLLDCGSLLPSRQRQKFPDSQTHRLSGLKYRYPQAEISAEPELARTGRIRRSTAHAQVFGCGLYLQPAQTTSAGLRSQPARKAGNNLSRMNTYRKFAANPRRMGTSKIIGFKASCNEHLQKMGGGEVILLPSGHSRAFCAQERKSTPLFSCGAHSFVDMSGCAASVMLRSHRLAKQW